MSAELHLAGAWVHHATELDFDAGLHAVALLTDDELAAWAEDCAPALLEDDGGPAGIRERIVEQLTLLRAGIVGDVTGDFPATVHDFEYRVTPDARWVFWCAGGTSWGEDPNEAYRAFSDLGYLPAVLHAVGFRMDNEEVLTDA